MMKKNLLFLLFASACTFNTAHAAPVGSGVPSAGLADAPVLFSPTARNAAADAMPTGYKRDAQAVRSIPVDINRAALFASPDSLPGITTKPARITLDLFGVPVVAELVRIENTERGMAWIGHVVPENGRFNQVVIVNNNGALAANISTEDGDYHVRFNGKGYELQKIDQSLYPRSEKPLPAFKLSTAQAGAAADAIAPQTDDGSVIDVMVVYTTIAKNAAGGKAAMESLIDLAIAETNQTYQNSDVKQRLRLVHSEEVSYAEKGVMEDDLDCITSTSDGCLDNVHALRNTYGADLVSFWVEEGGKYCGLAWVMDQVSPSFESRGFNVVARACATGIYVFGHELGHNMGLRHDVFVEDPSTVPSFPYAHGYTNFRAAYPWETIMAYPDACDEYGVECRRIPFWSNPALTRVFFPMGDENADEHRVLNDTARTVANFRASIPSPVATTGTVVEFYNSQLDNYFITGSASEASSIDGGSAGAGWVRTGIVFKAGGNKPVCRFYGSISPGPNSHFYTANDAECAELRQIQASASPKQPHWNFENFDFLTSAIVNNTCPTGTVPVYRAYNNGFTRGVDSNHRIATDPRAIQQVVARGWSFEGAVMCAPE